MAVSRKWQSFFLDMARHKLLLVRFMFLVREWQPGAGRLAREARFSPSKPCWNSLIVFWSPGLDVICLIARLAHQGDLRSCEFVIY